MPSINKTEAQWRKEDDARTLIEAEKIKSDKSRLSGAQQAAKSMVNEKKKEAAALSKVAGVTARQKATTRARTTARSTRKK